MWKRSGGMLLAFRTEDCGFKPPTGVKSRQITGIFKKMINTILTNYIVARHILGDFLAKLFGHLGIPSQGNNNNTTTTATTPPQQQQQQQQCLIIKNNFIDHLKHMYFY